jgi:cytochrome P450
MVTTEQVHPKPFPGPAAAGPTPRQAPRGPIERVELPTGILAWLVTKHDDVRQMLRSPDFSADPTRPGFPLMRRMPRQDPQRAAGLFIRMDAPEHTRLRRILTPEFMIKNMRTLEPLIQETVTEALRSMTAAGQPADLVEHFALPIPSMVICHMLGVPYTDHGFFQDRSRTLLAWSTPPAQAQAAGDDLRAYLSDLIDAKTADPGDDLVSRLVTERLATGEITRNEAVGLGFLLLIAGHETTANMIGLSTLLLLQHPEQLRQLRENPALIDDAVEELLRYLTIVRQGLPRIAIQDTVIGGQEIKAGEGAIALLSAANLDAAVFEAAEEFDVRRGSHQHVAFGFGVHQCLGQPLARAELRIALAELTQRLPGLALAGDPSELEYRDAIVYGVQRLPVTW